MMGSDGLDLSELYAFADELEAAAKRNPKRAKKLLQKQGNKLRSKTKSRAMQVYGRKHKKPKKYAGGDHYVDTIKRGKPYNFRAENVQAIRVYSSSPHAHLLEKGHNMVTHQPGKERVKFVPGDHIFENTANQFRPEFERACEDFSDEVAREVES